MNCAKLTCFSSPHQDKDVVVKENTIDLIPVDINKHLIWFFVTHSWEMWIKGQSGC